MNLVIALFCDLFRGEDRKPTLILLTSTVLIAVWWCLSTYLPHPVPESVAAVLSRLFPAEIVADLWGAFRILGSGALLLGLVPALIVKFVLRERLRDYGLQRGDLKLGLCWAIVLVPPLMYLAYSTAQRPEYRAVYPLNDRAQNCFLLHAAVQLAYYVAWEFHFRGFLLHGLKSRSGTSVAVWVQVMASVLAHLGKPGSEIAGALGGGVLWGLLSVQCRSILSSFLQHWLLGLSLDYFLCFPPGS